MIVAKAESLIAIDWANVDHAIELLEHREMSETAR